VATDIDLIRGQGQTIWHLPLPELFDGNQIRAHLDMAEIAIIAAGTGVTSLGNFCVSEMALGRQGCHCSPLLTPSFTITPRSTS
jgi:1,6-anhydro-N-acetylmuramate kinase